MSLTVETERMRLRRFASSDVDHLFDLDSDAEVMRFLNGGKPTPRDVIETEVLPLFMSFNSRPGVLGFWAAFENENGEFLGWFGLRPTTSGSSEEAELGYRLRRAVWGRGYATEGARVLIREGFAHGVKRITAGTYSENVASRRVMEKAGLKHVRTFRMTPTEIAAADTFQGSSDEVWDADDVEYALDAADWKNRCLLCDGTCPVCGGPVGRAAGSANWILCSSCHATFSHPRCADDRDQPVRASDT